MIRIIIVDTNRSNLGAMSSMLRNEGYDVEEFPHPESALVDLSRNAVDLVISDIDLPRIGGHTFLRRVRRQVQAPLIALNQGGDPEEEAICLAIGADDVVAKPVNEITFLARVNALLRRSSIKPAAAGATLAGKNAILRTGDLFLDATRLEARWKGNPIRLTKTEFNLLFSLAERPDVVRSRNQLQDMLSADNLNVSDRNIDSHIKRVRKKIRATDITFDSIQTVYGVGYKFMLDKSPAVLSLVA